MNSKKAFTLVELLVVISIIAMLLAIIMPALAKSREQARRTVCAARFHQDVIAFVAYATSDPKGRLPQGHFDGYSDPFFMDGGKEQKPTKVYGALLEIVKDARMLVCPNFAIQPEFRAGKDAITGQPANGCPFRPPFAGGWNFVFKLGLWYLGGHPSDTWGTPPPGVKAWTSPQKLTDKGGLPVLTCPVYDDVYGGLIIVSHSRKGFAQVAKSGGNARERENFIRNLGDGGGTNVGTLDGSVKFKKTTETQKHLQYHYGNYTLSNVK
jgi:prepilin-type N-terminal cleavage/methylation domain-containing protein